jgi:hypothetical protein
LPVAKTRVDYWVRLKAKRRTNEPTPRFFQREARDDDLRCLFARPRENVREPEHASLGVCRSCLCTHRRAHRDGTTSDAHDNSSRPPRRRPAAY